MKRIILLLIITLPLLMQSFTATSHSGRTDANGGHWDRSSGTYHYHNDGSYQGGNTSSASSSKKQTNGSVYTPDTHSQKTTKNINFNWLIYVLASICVILIISIVKFKNIINCLEEEKLHLSSKLLKLNKKYDESQNQLDILRNTHFPKATKPTQYSELIGENEYLKHITDTLRGRIKELEEYSEHHQIHGEYYKIVMVNLNDNKERTYDAYIITVTFTVPCIEKGKDISDKTITENHIVYAYYRTPGGKPLRNGFERFLSSEASGKEVQSYVDFNKETVIVSKYGNKFKVTSIKKK